MNTNSPANKFKYYLFFIFFFVTVSSAIVFYMTKVEHHEETKIYEATNPWRDTLSIDSEYVAQVSASQHIELRSLERGYLQDIYIDEGQYVKKGEKLFRVMPALLESEFDKTKAEYDLAKIEYDNTLALQKKDVVSENELSISKKRLDKAEAEMKLARTHLDLATIRAPFDGYIDRFHVRRGSLVEEGELLTMLSDTSTMWAYFNVSEAKYYEYVELKKHLNQDIQVKLKLANGKVYSDFGKIDTIEADFNNETGNIAFRASFPNHNNILRHGITGVVLMSEQHKDVLLVPQKATYEILDKKYVFSVDNESIIRSKEIIVTAEVPNLFIVASGITENDLVLTNGIGQVHDGQKVKTKIISNIDTLNNLQLPIG